MNPVRFGVVGAGVISQSHRKGIESAPGAEFTAICDVFVDKARQRAEGSGAKVFDDYRKMMDSGLVDAIMIATPHPSHPDIAFAAFERGIHVLCEKPLSQEIRSARAMVAAADKAGLKLGVCFQSRVSPLFMKAKEIIASGGIGAVTRAVWTITSCLRTAFYYDSGDWRGTWDSEGGGVLLNQCPHQLDMYQWLVGMPSRVKASVALGKYHDIYVEDDVTALLEWKDGASGVFIASTGEWPGVNRLEISGDRGRMVIEGDKIVLTRLAGSVAETVRTTDKVAEGPAATTETLSPAAAEGQLVGHAGLVKNFVEAIRGQAGLVSPGVEGLNSLELANAMILSGV
ncbi:MAG TPA: Gfo/Idh/MocA family oxidoreductase, partial [Candidatus Brocadiia bacterium]|nr:Gfo/Idh/MocA family oxidoreductase [Candidatus Brocadiia bacterium]